MKHTYFSIPFVTLLGILFFFSSCQNEQAPIDTTHTTAQETILNPHELSFPWNERTALVLYAGHTEDDNPDETFPSLIFLEYDDQVNFLLADGAPYLTVLSKQNMMEMIDKYTGESRNKTETTILSRMKTWVTAQSQTGYSYFLFELEPPSMAGKAYPLAKKADQESP